MGKKKIVFVALKKSLKGTKLSISLKTSIADSEDVLSIFVPFYV